MRFALPLLPAEFEIPDTWWQEAGMQGFQPAAAAYRSADPETTLIPLRAIEPPFRFPEVPKDFRGFDQKRLMDVLRGIAADTPLPSVRVLILPPLLDISRPPFAYRVLDGVHRFYASVAAGFDHLPAITRECVQ